MQVSSDRKIHTPYEKRSLPSILSTDSAVKTPLTLKRRCQPSVPSVTCSGSRSPWLAVNYSASSVTRRDTTVHQCDAWLRPPGFPSVLATFGDSRRRSISLALPFVLRPGSTFTPRTGAPCPTCGRGPVSSSAVLHVDARGGAGADRARDPSSSVSRGTLIRHYRSRIMNRRDTRERARTD